MNFAVTVYLQSYIELLVDKTKVQHKGGTLIEVLQVILRKTLLKKGSSSNFFPKTFSIKFSPNRALSVLLLIFTSCAERPVGAKFSYKVFGKRGLGGDSPQCGEMSRSDRGDRLRQRKNLSSER
ncbi:MAG: hypothetical protein IJK30_10200, partial [Ruminococcus sp.]|nr:hypothetical protein [Ruminococcus sp.]